MLLALDFAIYFYIAVSVTILKDSLANPYGVMVEEHVPYSWVQIFVSMAILAV